MKNCIIFGAGFIGRYAYYKLVQVYNVIGYADNNQNLWGKELNGKKIFSPEKIKEYECDVVICSDYFQEIQKQLLEMDVKCIRIIEPLGYMLYEYNPENVMKPVEFPGRYAPYKKKTEKMHILYVQQYPCTRTHKLAELMWKKGIDVSIAYTFASPEAVHPQYAKLYTNSNAFYSVQDLIDYVNESEYDIVHCSNEPDDLTNYMLLTNKPIVHDTHDLMSICYKSQRDMLALEYLANQQSDGLIYVNEYNLQLAEERFHINREKAIVIENRPSELALLAERLPKLSDVDGQIHCVYEGDVSKKREYYRYTEDIWIRLAESGVHVHFYTFADPEFCRGIAAKHENIHYEGVVNSSKIVQELTKYDCGLLLFQDLSDYKLFLDTALPNKIFEYLAAEIPSVVGNVKLHKEFVSRYGVGAYLDMAKDIKSQLEEIVKIQIEENFIEKKQLTMKAQTDKLLKFYQKTIERYKRKKR